MTYTTTTELTYTDLAVVVPMCVDHFMDAKADGETLGINELIEGYADAHGVDFSEDARSDLAHLLRIAIDEAVDVEVGSLVELSCTHPAGAFTVMEIGGSGSLILFNEDHGRLVVAPRDVTKVL